MKTYKRAICRLLMVALLTCVAVLPGRAESVTHDHTSELAPTYHITGFDFLDSVLNVLMDVTQRCDCEKCIDVPPRGRD